MLKWMQAEIVMYLVMSGWLCLRGFYGESRILVAYLACIPGIYLSLCFSLKIVYYCYPWHGARR